MRFHYLGMVTRPRCRVTDVLSVRMTRLTIYN